MNILVVGLLAVAFIMQSWAVFRMQRVFELQDIRINLLNKRLDFQIDALTLLDKRIDLLQKD